MFSDVCWLYIPLTEMLFYRMADMMERNALRNAQANATQVEMLVDQAMRASPAVQPVGRVNIAQGYVLPPP